jgi:hypothetical protein
MAKRKAVSKKLRFEIFKRDKFTCQYCGRKAPDVVLQADHINPVAKGGKNSILNLVTSCFDCNAGKKDRTLDDDSVVAIQRQQLEALQERREQLQMMIDWQRTLVDLDAEAVEHAATFWCDLADWYGVTESGRQKLRQAIRRFGLEELLEAMRSSTSYYRYDDDGVPTEESTNHAFSKLSAICAIRLADAESPYLKNVFYIRGVLKNRFTMYPERLAQAKQLLVQAFEVGLERDEIYSIACEASSYTGWFTRMQEEIDAASEDSGEVA